jgi:ATP-binding cassette subfamily C (CFTR/MRP) protein 1
MDEATASIDMRTEGIIQKAINSILKNSTVITIAHRIKTILHYDRILVLNYGEVMEYDSPDTLIADKSSMFYELYKKSNI